MEQRKIRWELFWAFLKIGTFTFGGGYAMIALISREFVEKRKWIDQDDFLDLVAIAESTPGPIAINAATYIGYRVGKVWGSLAATLGVCIPSFVIIYLISLFFEAFVAAEYVGYAFQGIQVCVAYLILSAGIRMAKKMKKTVFNYLILGLSASTLLVTTLLAAKVSAILYICAGAVAGLVVYGLASCKKKREAES